MKILLTLALLFTATVAKAQNDNYLSDLSALRLLLQKTPSYKAQIQGSELISYNELYKSLATDTAGDLSNYEQFFKLSHLLFLIRDNHLGFYQTPVFSHFKDSVSINNYIASEEFQLYPKVELNIDSLKNELMQKHADSTEGIYHYGNSYIVGLFRSSEKEYLGVVVDSNVKFWQKGQIAVRLYQSGPSAYKAVYGHPVQKYFTFQNNEKLRNQTLLNSQFYAYGAYNQYSKQQYQKDYVNIPIKASKFELKRVAADVQYLMIRSFQINEATRQQSQAFYESIKDSLTAANVILDLRNNEGGAPKEMLKYFKLLKSYSKKGNIYVLLNNETLSQAEIFTLKLMRLKNTTTAGQTTKGMLSYGSNYGKRVILPSGRYTLYITDTQNKRQFLAYEDYGIEPAIELEHESDWIGQIIERIREKNPIVPEASLMKRD
ncbi:S41 family peptidase [uncultured Pontibacter sp.]|uniref:S41 family peptidase n=1 Tax=uncultured Pontibacter sp. TaxID=453356 RepID=UPI0026338C9F|nr:S41 family peptidase [uncultured Pontibacter sp.]